MPPPEAPDTDEADLGYSPTVEAEILGHLLNGRLTTDQIPPELIIGARATHLLAAIRAAADDSGSTDPTTVLHQLQTTGSVDKAGGGQTVLRLASDASGDPAYWLRHAHAWATRRRVTTVLTRARQRLDQAGTNVDDIEAGLWDDLAELADPTRRTRAGLQLTDFHELLAAPSLPTEWLAKPLLAAGRVTTLYAPGKTGKSLIAMEVAAAKATGRPVLTSPGGEQHHVLYVDQEMTPTDWRERLVDMHYGLDDTDELNRYLHLAQLHGWPALDTHEGGRELTRAADTLRASIVIIDTVSKLLSGPENDNDTHRDFYRHTVVPLKAAGIAVLVLDHTGKDIERGARGGSAKTDNVDLVQELLFRSQTKDGLARLTMRATHQRFADEALDVPCYLLRQKNPLRHFVESNAEHSERLVEICLGHFRSANVPLDESGATTLREFRKQGLKFTTDTFYEARRRWHLEAGWQ